MLFSPCRLALAVAVSFALAGSLSACGGGSNVRPSNPQPADSCTNNPDASGCQPPSGSTSSGASGQYPAGNQLVPTHVLEAQKDGYTGKGVKVALMDSGIDPALAPFKNLAIHFQSFLSADTGVTTPSDTDGHGSVMAQTLAGEKTDDFAGGIAPDVDLYVGQICSNAQGGCGVGVADAETFYDQGVRLFNYSLGGVSESPDDPAFKRFIGGFQSMVSGGSLLVWAAGNNGPDKLSAYAAAPQVVPNLEQGWLAAVNVSVDDNGKVTGLDKDSAQCGVAADWCLAAPGYVKNVPVPGSDFTTGYADGTSTSTAVITGVAALVWQAFPWMSGHNVQQTVLTTATHMGGGDPDQPNATYGWGLVNAQKAVHGPAQFVDEFDADVGDDTSTFSNPIGGAGSLVLDGASDGQLELAAGNTYSGGTMINGATLYLSGSLASTVTLDGGALAGYGTVNGDVVNTSGNLDSEGGKDGHGLTIAGNYTAGADSSTTIALGHPLDVGNKASLDGTLHLSPADSSYQPQSTETLIHAGSVTGKFARTDTSQLTMYDTIVNYTAAGVTASLTRSPVAEAVPQSNPVVAHASQGIEKALDQADVWSRNDYAGHKAFLDNAARFLSASTESRAVASVASLSGEIHGTVDAIEASASRQVDDALAWRQNGMRPGQRKAIWAQVLAGAGGLSQTGYASARYRGHGVLAGLDIPVTDHFAGGLLVGSHHMDAHLDALAGRANERATLAGGYARYVFGKGAYLAGRATWTHANINVNRSALIGSSLQKLHGVRTDGIGRFTLEAGRSFGGVTPYVSVTAMRMNQDAFTEKGAAGFGLAAPSQHHDITLAGLGMRFAHAFAWAGGYSKFAGYLGWRRVLSGDRMDFTAALAATPQAVFTATGQSLTRNVGQAGAKIDTRISRVWDWYLDLDAQSDPGRYHAFAANAGIRCRF